jgi:hypothetical protein
MNNRLLGGFAIAALVAVAAATIAIGSYGASNRCRGFDTSSVAINYEARVNSR